MKDDGRYKARLVAKGFAQRKGKEYDEIFAPVVRHTSIRILLALVAIYDLELEQLDVKTAFLHGDLDEDIYMEQPEGFVVEGKSELVCKLKKSLYDLKQSPRQCIRDLIISCLKVASIVASRMLVFTSRG